MAAQTLAQMNLLTFSPLMAGVVDQIVEREPFLARLPFEDFQGNAFTYVRENTVPSGVFYDVDDTLSSTNPTYTSHTLTLKQVYGQADVPKLARTKSNVNDIAAIEALKVSKGMTRTIHDKFVYGNATSTPTEFDGLHALTSASFSTAEGSSSTGSALNFSNLDTNMNFVERQFGEPDIIMLNSTIRNRIRQFITVANAGLFNQTPDGFGRIVLSYNSVPIAVNDFMTQTETISSGTFSAKTGGATSSLFNIKFGDSSSGLFAIQGAGGMQPEIFPVLEDKDNMRVRVTWYLAMGLGPTRALARVDGITDAAVAA